MKYAIFDIGSNSVRMMLWDGKTLEKRIRITGLGKGLNAGKVLDAAAMARTLEAISEFKKYAEEKGAEGYFAYGTAAMRRAENGKAFAERIVRETGVETEIIDGEEEAAIGLRGALAGRDGGIVDIGGASTEITVASGGRKIYSYSLDLGTVTLTDACGQNAAEAERYCAEKVKEYGEIPKAEYYGIGGTATSLAAIDLGTEPYDPAQVNGHRIGLKRIGEIAKTLSSMRVEERKKLKGLQPERADVIANGAILLRSIMERYGIEEITVSESDNLEGYALSRFGKKEDKR